MEAYTVGATSATAAEARKKAEVCIEGESYNANKCRNRNPRRRSSICSNVSPTDSYNCEEQAGWGKCDDPFIFVGSWCLESCGRCGGTYLLKNKKERAMDKIHYLFHRQSV